MQWESFTAALERVEDPGTKRVLTWVRDLFGLTLVERHLAWYLVNGRLSAGRARTVTSYIDRLVARLRPHAQDLVDAFGFEQAHLRAPIASGAEQARQDEARAYYRAQRASGDAPIPWRGAMEEYDAFVRARTPALLRSAFLLTGDQQLADDPGR